jgi:hypothetical protein
VVREGKKVMTEISREERVFSSAGKNFIDSGYKSLYSTLPV